MLVGVTHVEQRQVPAQARQDLVETDDELGMLPHAQADRPLAGATRGKLAAGRAPGREPAVQHLHPRMADVLQDPRIARGPHPGLLLVEHDRPLGRGAGVRVTHRHIFRERGETVRPRVHREDVVGAEIDRARDVAFRVVGGPARVDDHHLAAPRFLQELPGLDQEIHSAPEKR